jgi:TolA-binding protein
MGWRFCAVLLLAVAATGCGKKSPGDLLQQAGTMMQNRDVYGAEMMFQKILEQYPDSQEAIYARQGLIQCYRQTKDFDSAMEQLEVLTGIYGGPQTPDGYQALQMKVRLLADQRRFADAIGAIDATSPTMQTAPLEMRAGLAGMAIQLLMADNRAAQAQAQSVALLETVAADPALHADALKLISTAHGAESDRPALMEVYRGYLERFPDSPWVPDVLFASGHLLETDGQTEQAGEAYDKAEVALNGLIESSLGAEAKIGYLLRLAGLCQARGRTEQSRVALERIVADYPATPDAGRAMLGLAALDVGAGRLDTASERYARVMTEFPQTELAQHAFQLLQSVRQAQATSPTLNIDLPTTAGLAAEEVPDEAVGEAIGETVSEAVGGAVGVTQDDDTDGAAGP